MESISVVIYGFNEEKSIEVVVRETLAVLRELTEHFEVILVDDGSRDKTPQISERLHGEFPEVQPLRHRVNMGIGACLKDGFQAARCDWVTYLPADGQLSPTDVERLASAMADADMVTSYYSHRGDTVIRKFVSFVLRVIVFVLFGPHPRINGSYMFRRKILSEIPLISDTFVLNFEFPIKARRKGLRIKEIETVALPRKEGSSKVFNIKSILRVIRELVKLRRRMAAGE